MNENQYSDIWALWKVRFFVESGCAKFEREVSFWKDVDVASQKILVLLGRCTDRVCCGACADSETYITCEGCTERGESRVECDPRNEFEIIDDHVLIYSDGLLFDGVNETFIRSAATHLRDCGCMSKSDFNALESLDSWGTQANSRFSYMLSIGATVNDSQIINNSQNDIPIVEIPLGSEDSAASMQLKITTEQALRSVVWTYPNQTPTPYGPYALDKCPQWVTLGVRQEYKDGNYPSHYFTLAVNENILFEANKYPFIWSQSAESTYDYQLSGNPKIRIGSAGLSVKQLIIDPSACCGGCTAAIGVPPEGSHTQDPNHNDSSVHG